jgi:hypothetical protein
LLFGLTASCGLEWRDSAPPEAKGEPSGSHPSARLKTEPADGPDDSDLTGKWRRARSEEASGMSG